MSNCAIDVTIEFLGVAFHNILYYVQVYPESIFETRRKYSLVVHRSMHPEVNQYIDLCLKSVAECLKNNQLERIEFAITDGTYKPLLKFVFDLDKDISQDETADAYLVQCEQNMRAFCLNLVSVTKNFNNLPKDKSFTIYIHTNESSAVALAANPDLEEFPLVEVDSKDNDTSKIIPLRRFTLRSCCFNTYVEL